jgi:hypothetical protein
MLALAVPLCHQDQALIHQAVKYAGSRTHLLSRIENQNLYAISRQIRAMDILGIPPVQTNFAAAHRLHEVFEVVAFFCGPELRAALAKLPHWGRGRVHSSAPIDRPKQAPSRSAVKRRCLAILHSKPQNGNFDP